MSCKNKVTVKKSNRYCGEDLDCINVHKGDTYDSALANINEVVCEEFSNSCANFNISLNPVHFGEYPEYINIPEIVINGGEPPYSFNWTLQQTGGTSYIIGNDEAEDYQTLIGSMVIEDECGGVVGQGIPCRISYANGITDVTHVWHFKLTVTDANGCTASDYWTHYHVNTH